MGKPWENHRKPWEKPWENHPNISKHTISSLLERNALPCSALQSTMFLRLNTLAESTSTSSYMMMRHLVRPFPHPTKHQYVLKSPDFSYQVKLSTTSPKICSEPDHATMNPEQQICWCFVLHAGASWLMLVDCFKLLVHDWKKNISTWCSRLWAF